MTSETLEDEIKEAIPKLFDIARSLTRNNISENYKFILTEIIDIRALVSADGTQAIGSIGSNLNLGF